MLPFAKPYPPEVESGFWGVPTSTIDWCEENYILSPYIAECLNTVTNSGFIFLALLSIYQAYKNKLELRFIVTGAGFLLVGVGSWLFHMTLRYEYQLLDELPMLYATCVPFWSFFSEFKSPRGSMYVGSILFLAVALLTLVYLWFQDPTIHQVAYALLNFGVIVKSFRLTKSHVDDSEARSTLNSTMFIGLSTFFLGYCLWMLDVHFCDLARETRRLWGMPYGFILEGHGWWHLFTGLGVYFYLVNMELLRSWLNGTHRFYQLKKVCGLPVLTLVDPVGLADFRSTRKKSV